MYQLELLLNEILIELRKLTASLPEQLSMSLPERTPSERDDLHKSKVESMNFGISRYTHAASSPPLDGISALNRNKSTPFTPHTVVNQPTPPPLPSSVRMKWTTAHEQLITDCATSPHGTYRNSLKRLTDKLPEGTTVSAIRNKCNSMGYKIHKKYLVHK